MIVILGGAYQQKRAFAMEKYHLAPADFCDCTNAAPDLSRRALCHMEQYVLSCIRTGHDEQALLQNAALQDKILIFDDISCGVVPMEAEQRRWRERTGRFAAALARQADAVWRVFFGLGRQLK